MTYNKIGEPPQGLGSFSAPRRHTGWEIREFSRIAVSRSSSPSGNGQPSPLRNSSGVFRFPIFPETDRAIPHHATVSRKASGTRFHASRPAPPPVGEKQHPATERNGQIWHHRLPASNPQIFNLQIFNLQIFNHQILKSPIVKSSKVSRSPPHRNCHSSLNESEETLYPDRLRQMGRSLPKGPTRPRRLPSPATGEHPHHRLTPSGSPCRTDEPVPGRRTFLLPLPSRAVFLPVSRITVRRRFSAPSSGRTEFRSPSPGEPEPSETRFWWLMASCRGRNQHRNRHFENDKAFAS